MSRSYSFEAEIAQETDITARYIEKPGTYSGKFTAAWYEQSRSGAECIKFRFVADNGSQANNLAIYTHNGQGETLPGYRLIQKMMACMKVKGLHAREDTIECFDYASKRMIKQPQQVYPGLYGPIGLVLTTEEYQGKYEIKTQLIIYSVFDPHTQLMADEILKGHATPAALDRLSDYLTEKKKWHKPLDTPTTPQTAPPQTQTQHQTENDFADDAIPF